MTGPLPDGRKSGGKPRTRIQEINRKIILDAALDVFSAYGFRGSTLDQIAEKAGMASHLKKGATQHSQGQKILSIGQNCRSAVN